jgi:hypothetical protein
VSDYEVWSYVTFAWSCRWPGCKYAGHGMGSQEAAEKVASAHIADHRHRDPEGFYDPTLFPDDWKTAP